MIKTIIFDMNGVIIDDEPLHEVAFKDICRKYGKVLSTEEYRRLCMGQSDREGSQTLIKHFKLDVPWETLFDEKQKKYFEFAEQELIPVPGLVDALKRLQGAYQLAVGSSIRRSDIEYVLDRFGIRKYFSVWVGRDEVKYSKPKPDIYLEVAKRLDVSPAKCLVIEDSLVGIRAAKNAGMVCLGITTTHTANELTGADRCFDSFDQLTVDFIESLG